MNLQVIAADRFSCFANGTKDLQDVGDRKPMDGVVFSSIGSVAFFREAFGTNLPTTRSQAEPYSSSILSRYLAGRLIHARAGQALAGTIPEKGANASCHNVLCRYSSSLNAVSFN
jgi:hypothetical protein